MQDCPLRFLACLSMVVGILLNLAVLVRDASEARKSIAYHCNFSAAIRNHVASDQFQARPSERGQHRLVPLRLGLPFHEYRP